MSLSMKQFHIKGIAPLLMHNGALADPMSENSIEMKKITSKRGKTEEDQELMAEMEFKGGLYLDEKHHPCIPGELIEACIINGSKKTKNGQKMKSALLCDGLWPLEYKGPKNPDDLWSDKEFRDRRGVVVSQSRIFRTRPRFNEWELTFTVTYNPELVDVATLDKAVEDAGRECGLGDYRPKFGRFIVKTK